MFTLSSQLPFDEIISLVIIVAQLITDVPLLMMNLFVFNRVIAVQIWASGANTPSKISKSFANTSASNKEFSGFRGTWLGASAGLEIWCLGWQVSPFSELDLGTYLYEIELDISFKTMSNKDAEKKTSLNSISGANSIM